MDPSQDINVAEGDIRENEMAEGVDAVSPAHTMPMKGTNGPPEIYTNAAINWQPLSLRHASANSDDMDGYQQFHSPQAGPASQPFTSFPSIDEMALNYHESVAVGMYTTVYIYIYLYMYVYSAQCHTVHCIL